MKTLISIITLSLGLLCFAESRTVGELRDGDTVITKESNGAAKMLPKYLWINDFYDSYTNDAAWYYSQPQDYGHCSAMRSGDFLYRNLDWRFDNAADVIVRMFAGEGRFASVGVANCGTNLTEDIIASGVPSRYFKCLPGRTVDGINENGVAVEVNVVDGDVDYWDNPNGDIHPLGAVRWVLDNATNALHAATELSMRIKFPEGWTQNFHWMIADKDTTYIVEDGAYYPVTGKAVMTNFRLYPAPVFGPGWERYKLLTTNLTASITNVWYTRAYADDTEWLSEFVDKAEMNAAKIAWDNGKGKESHRGEHFGNKWWWQTVHTSIYDLKNRTLRIAVQEVDDWHVFAVPSSGGVKPEAVREIVSPMIASSTNGLRRVEDMAVYEVVRTENTDWKWTSENKELEARLKSLDVKPYISPSGDWLINESLPEYPFYGQVDGDFAASSTNLVFAFNTDTIHATATRPRYIDERISSSTNAALAAVVTNGTGAVSTGDLVKLDANGRFVKATAGADYIKDHQDISGKRDKTDLTVYGGTQYHFEATTSPTNLNCSANWNGEYFAVDEIGGDRVASYFAESYESLPDEFTISGYDIWEDYRDRVTNIVVRKVYDDRLATEAAGTDRQVVRGRSQGDVGDYPMYIIRVADAASADAASRATADGTGNDITQTYATKTELAAKRDLTDNTCHKTEFTEWVASGVPEGITLIRQPSIEKSPSAEPSWTWWYREVASGTTRAYIVYPYDSNQNATELTFREYDDLHPSFTATRSAVCTTSETFVTHSYVTNAVSSAKYVPSATDQTFSNAVLAVNVDFATNTTGAAYVAVTNALAGFGFDADALGDIPGGKVYGSIGALLASLAAAVAWLKKKIFDSDGKPTDKFAADLMGRQVAISAIDGQVDARTKTNASAVSGNALTLSDGGVVSASSSAPTITFDTARQTNGLRFCELYLTNPDSAADGAIVSISGKVYSDISLTDLPKLEKGATYYFTFAEFKVTQETVEGETVNVSHWKVSKQKLDAMGGDIPTAA